ncbi:MAG: hypothetical protein LBH54_05860 [Clostridiales bacterium]|jgi:hypothetical protein|nr:hypothetical protein [Clostridiales bacterium]
MSGIHHQLYALRRFVKSAEWFAPSENTTYHTEDENSRIQLDAVSGELTYKPSGYDVGTLITFYVYAENEAGRSRGVAVKVQITKTRNAHNAVIFAKKDTYQINSANLPALDYEYRHFVFAGDIIMNGNLFLKALLDGLELTRGTQYTLENKSAVFGGNAIKIFGIKKEVCDDLSIGQHTVTLCRILRQRAGMILAGGTQGNTAAESA